VRIISRRTLKEFAESLETALEAWFYEVRRAAWKTPADVKRSYANSSLVGNDRVVFNIKGNSYRLVVAINYRRAIVFVKWFGSHAEYDRIDIEKVDYGD
jgi:mRNA interferase HigB